MDAMLERVRLELADRYRVDRELGRGGMATVYLAWELKHPRWVAVKVLHPHLASAIGVERFIREIRTCSGFAHPHILPVFDSDERGGLLYYVMPFVEGETLRHRLSRQGPLGLEEVVRIGTDVARALDYAHRHGVVHRDVKPENVLFVEGAAVVADFGIALALADASAEPLTISGMILGTPAYVSPEQASGDPVDGRSDVYALGCMLYELIIGAPPFTGPTVQAVIARHLHDPVPPLRSVRPAVPESLERVILRALAKAPADRFATAAAFADALRAPPSGDGDADSGESVAVLPFTNLSADPDTDYFSDGITEEIINAVAHIPGLRVAARGSSFAFRGRAFDLAEVGAKLKVATVLQGSVRRAGSRLRVTAQLNRVDTGFSLWSERYDREMTDVFAIQEEIANAIADRLQGTRDPGGYGALITPPTENLDAYHFYLKGRYHWAQRGLGLKKALECFTHALEFDPQYALAHAGLADACTLLAQYGLASPAQIVPRARAAVERALELAPHLAEAHCAAGILALVFDWDWPRTAAALQRAIELTPRYLPAHHWLATYLTFVAGRFDEGVLQARQTVALDPLAPLAHAQLGLVLVGAGRYDEAVAPLRRAIELGPALFLPYNYLGVLYHYLGRTEEAVAALEHAVAISGRHQWPLAALAVCLSALGRMADVEAIHAELSARARREYVMSSTLALLTAALGRVDEAFALLDRACDERDGIMIYSKRYPAFGLLQADPRMQRIHGRVGLTA
jgi:serine/threonine-protein kinase